MADDNGSANGMSTDGPDKQKSADENRNFHHPYDAYPIQVDFMTSLYDALDNYKVGIFESPTGTGKTLSLICASMTWLREFKQKSLYTEPSVSLDEPAWIRQESAKMRLRAQEDRLREFEEKMQHIREIETRERHQSESGNIKTIKKPRITGPAIESMDDYLLNEVDPLKSSSGVSSNVQKLLDKLSEQNEVLKPDDNVLENPVKIFFTSRTHSQLSQFVGQLKLTSFPPSIKASDYTEHVKEIPLGSRKQLCIHEKVSKLKSVQQMNDACLEMQKSGSAKCQYLKTENNLESRVQLNQFQNKALAEIRDIEDLVRVGEETSTCPYYGVRGNPIRQAEIVTLPYQLLLQKSSRESLSIDLKDSVVIIDEAHNILDVISAINSVSTSFSEVNRALKGLDIYRAKFNSRLSSSNKNYLSQTIKVVTNLVEFLEAAAKKPAKEVSPGTPVKPTDLIGKGTADMVNIYKLEKFLKTSKLAFKIDSYLDKLEKEEQQKSNKQQPAHDRLVLSKVIQFLSALTNPSSEGKVFYGRSPSSKELLLQYLLLDPSKQFEEVVDSARCVILAGGTMEPVNDYLNYLFPTVERSRIKLFSCGHVIPKKNLSVTTISTGYGQKMLFTFATRNSVPLHTGLGKSLLDIVKVTPKGVVVFFPSYQHLNIVTQWKSDGLLSQIELLKPVFIESREGSVDKILAQYDQAISAKNGAILFSVVGGKMSEGINFSDDRARAVVMVGMPFPNLYSAEMTAKRQYIENSILSNGGSKAEALAGAKDYYENTCMRAVNQGIGRAIRHAGDHAAVILVDERYSTNRIQCKLPNWIQRELSKEYTGLDVAEARDKLHEFFQSHV